MSMWKKLFISEGAGFARRPAAVYGLALMVVVLAGCDINKPEMPSFDTRLTVPLGLERLDVMDAVDSEDFLSSGPDGSLLFQVDGGPDTLAFDFDLTVEMPMQSISEGLGDFAVGGFDPLEYGFELGEVWPPSNGVEGLTTVVPAFPIALTSSDQDVPDIESATLARGTATITVANGLAVPISAASGPDQLVLVLEDPSNGVPFASFTFGAIAAGAGQTRTVDLAGSILPDRLRVRLQGGSPGSDGGVVTISGSDVLSVTAAFADLLVSSATAVVGPQSFTTRFSSALPSGYEVTEAAIAGGSTQLQMVNDLPLPCVATLTWDGLQDALGQPYSTTFNLPGGGSLVRTLDFAGCRVVAGTTAVTAFEAEVSVTTTGSGGAPVTINGGDGLSATLSAGTISFSSVTGSIPETTVNLEPSIQHIDLPDELQGLRLTAASLTLKLDSAATLPGTVDLTLRGVAADGDVSVLNIHESLVPGPDQAITEIVLDQDNSAIVGFLNNLPERITLTGSVTLGGGGTTGTVSPGDDAVVSWRIQAPVEVVIDGASLDSDPRALDIDPDMRDRIATHALGASVQLEVLNHLPLALEVLVVLGHDILTLDTAPLLTIGPLAVASASTSPSTHIVTQPVISRPSFSLTAAQAQIFGSPGLYAKFVATLPSSNGQPARVLSTDFVEIRGVVQLDVLVDDRF